MNSGGGTPPAVTPQDIIAFWRAAGPDRWYAKDEAFDAEIRERFGAVHAEAVAGRLDRWAETPEGALALLILLDQFSRNLHRGSARAFAADTRAREIAEAALGRGHDRAVPQEMRPFLYLPFMHSESLADQERSVVLFHAIPGRENLPYALDHRAIIRRFGRFPHRNAALGRHTSPAEAAFLESGGFAG